VCCCTAAVPRSAPPWKRILLLGMTDLRQVSNEARGLWHQLRLSEAVGWPHDLDSRLGRDTECATAHRGAQASDVGWLLAAESAPVLLVGMFAGVWVDRFPRRRLLTGADLGRAALLACIPLVALVGVLRMEHLYVVALATGVLTVVFDVAYWSFVPDLVGAETKAFTAVETKAPDGGFHGNRRGIARRPKQSAAEYAGYLGSSAQFLRNVHRCAVRAVGLRELGLSPLLVGLSVRVAASAISGVLYWSTCDGTAGRRRADNGRGHAHWQHDAVPCCAGSGAAGGRIHRPGGGTVAGHYPPLYSVNALTLRQVTTPPHLLGRVNATLHVVERGVIPFGALACGMLGDAIGLRPTLLVAAAGVALGTIWAARSGLLRQR